jgi:MerR family transcriptional regulator/heat shock protein HspR
MVARKRQQNKRNAPLYMISVAAELSGMHPQTLRIYERKQLINPQRSAGNTRLYSEADIERLRLIHSLTQDEGINLAGVERIMALQQELECARAEAETLRRHVKEARRQALAEIDQAKREQRAEIVMVRRGGLARRIEGRE